MSRHESPRYLVRFHPKRLRHVFADVLILGSGIAGMRAALATPPDLRVLILAKELPETSNSAWAQGGLAGVLSPEDSLSNHVRDTLIAGDGLCNMEIAQEVIRDAPGQITDLVNFGVDFDRIGNQLALTTEGGHSHARIVHALGDATGKEVMRAMIARARTLPHIEIWDKCIVIDLLTHEGCCVGALVSSVHGERLMIWSKQTILASGGCGRIYRESTNSPIATGDGMAAAFRAGARLRDMEFMQFHPTVLYVAGSSRSLISEAVRGEGAFLRDKDGDRFMLAEDSRAERATRDIVARAIFRAMNRTQHPNVYLDLRHLNADHVHMRFPGIARACHEFDLDIARDLIPVRPGAHYTIGGVAVDPNGRTSLAGLWAAGEVTSSGLHGANRLASNSLIEGLVFGTRCGAGASEEASRLPDSYHVPPITEKEVRDSGQNLDVEDIMNSLRSLMGRSVGIERTGEELEKARTMVDFWCGYVWRREFSGREGWELSNLLVMARLMIQGALTRTESRGTHFRRDHPLKDDACWKRHVDCPIRQTSAPTIVPSDTGA